MIGFRAPHRKDLLAALAVTVLAVVTLLLEPVGSGADVTRAADAAAVLLTLGMVLPLAWRRRHPVGSLLPAGVCAVVAFHLGYAATVGVLAVWLATGSAAALSSRRTALALMLLGAVAVAGSVALLPGTDVTVLVMLGAATTGLLPAVVGDALRTQRALTHEVREHARRVEELRDADVLRARAEERVEIARDVHDGVGHHLGAITLQAAAAGAIDNGSQPQVTEVLDTIRRLSADALDEIGELLTTLRTGDTSRSPGLTDLDGLYAAVRSAGVPVTHEHRIAVAVPSALQACAFRVVQEALTNVGRHAMPAAARVDIEAVPHHLVITVEDDGRGRPAPPRPARHGLLGMRERVARLGGELDAGPHARGGWRIQARLPLTA